MFQERLDSGFAICEDCVGKMNIVSRKTLADFGAMHSDARIPSGAWFKVVSNASWGNLAEVRQTYPSVDLVGRLTVFDIAGNKYRLITKVTYPIGSTNGTVYIRSVLTHAEYSKEGWKNDPWF